MSKSAKKNKQRKKKKEQTKGATETGQRDDGTPGPEELLRLLREELNIAKETKDHATAGKIREQIWVLTDLVNGVKTQISDEELQPILASLTKRTTPQSQPEVEEKPPKPKLASGSPHLVQDLNLSKLKKKLTQIEQMKEKQKKGGKLEKNQLEKLAKEDELRKEIDDLEEMINSIAAAKLSDNS